MNNVAPLCWRGQVLAVILQSSPPGQTDRPHISGSEVSLDRDSKTFTLSLSINTEVCAVMDYFEIFLQRMLLCRKAAERLGLRFGLVINDQVVL